MDLVDYSLTRYCYPLDDLHMVYSCAFPHTHAHIALPTFILLFAPLPLNMVIHYHTFVVILYVCRPFMVALFIPHLVPC